MNPRTTAILLVVALILGAFVYLFEVRGSDVRREAEEQARRLFPGVAQEDVEWIALTTSDGTPARIERREDGWELVEPVVFPADRFAIDGMASNLATLVTEEEIEDPVEAAEYGLDEAARSVRFAAAGAVHELALGRSTPVGANTYAITGDGDAIYTVQTYKAQSFDRALDDLRDKRILDFDTASIARIEARWPGGGVALERTAGGDKEQSGTWRLTSPIEGRADDETVEDLLSDLSYLRAEGFVDEPLGDAEAGLDAPAFEIVLTPETPEGEGEPAAAPLRLAVGALRDGERLVRAAHPSFFTIGADRLEDLPRELIAYRFKQLARFAIGDAKRVDFFFQAEAGDPVAVTAKLGADGWSSSPEPMDAETIAQLVSELSRLRAADILADAVGDDELRGLGLAPPNTIVSVFGAASEAGAGEDEPAAAPKLAEIHIGDFQGPDGIIARAVGDPAVYRIDHTLAEYVPVSLDAFRNRFVSEQDAEAPPDEAAQDFLSPTQESP